MKEIKRIKDIDFSGFYCSKCGREIKKAYSIDGKGSFGSRCVLTEVGYKYEKTIKKIDSLVKVWDKIINNPKMYSLDVYCEAMGGIDVVEKMFFIRGSLG